MVKPLNVVPVPFESCTGWPVLVSWTVKPLEFAVVTWPVTARLWRLPLEAAGVVTVTVGLMVILDWMEEFMLKSSASVIGVLALSVSGKGLDVMLTEAEFSVGLTVQIAPMLHVVPLTESAAVELF